jgi:ribulose 1,5-bisphosphate carboxylase large subunit-like protein
MNKQDNRSRFPWIADLVDLHAKNGIPAKVDFIKDGDEIIGEKKYNDLMSRPSYVYDREFWDGKNR